MSIPKVSGSVIEFMELVSLNIPSTPKEISNKNLLVNCIHNYSAKDGCCGKLKRFFYIVWQAVKRVFGCGSDWQKTTRMLVEHTLSYWDMQGLSPEQIKQLKTDLSSRIDKILLQLLKDNEKNKSAFSEEFVALTSGSKTTKQFANQLISPLLITLEGLTPNLKLFVETIPKNHQKEFLDNMFSACDSRISQRANMQEFENACQGPPHLVQSMIQTMTEDLKALYAFADNVKEKQKTNPSYQPSQQEQQAFLQRNNDLQSRMHAFLHPYAINL